MAGIVLELGEQLLVLRDEALATSEFGVDAPGTEFFEAIVARVSRLHEEESDLDMTLRDALNRRLAWGEDPSTIIVDCDTVCRRLLVAVRRSFRNSKETTLVATLIAEVSCAAAHHLARNAVERTSKERALQRRELMVQRQLEAAITEQEEQIRAYSEQLAES